MMARTVPVPATAGALPPTSALPTRVQQYVLTGTEPSTVRRDLVTSLNQIPRWGYFAIAATSAWLGRKAYLEWKRSKSSAPAG